MKFFATPQIRELDQYTIEHEPIASIDLMERAADAVCWKYLQQFKYQSPVCVIAGPGNNGGDALAVARTLLNTGISLQVLLIHTGKLSADCETNRQRLLDKFPDKLTELNNEFIAPGISDDTIIIDGLFGSGLSRPLAGIFSEAVLWINQTGCEVLSIDIPSGLNGELTADLSKPIVTANYTYSLQFPKLAFFLSENAGYVGQWGVPDIGIMPEAIQNAESNFFYLEEDDVKPILHLRPKFSNKGTFGHALLIAGSKGMAGASVLGAKAALRSGAGLVTVHGPEANRIIVQTAVPEAIFQEDLASDYITGLPALNTYNAIAIGPGIGMRTETADMLREFLKVIDKPCILDADALNIIGQQKDLLQLIPNGSILTPHPKEFERIFGKCNNSYERITKACIAAQKYNIIIILKGAHTLIATSNSRLFFNSTGNSGMATAGSGDVLTGILVGLMAQGYSPEETAKLGVFLHGRAGDLTLNQESKESLIAGDIIDSLGKAFSGIQ